MSLLACDRDPVAVGVVDDGYWDLEAQLGHIPGTQRGLAGKPKRL